MCRSHVEGYKRCKGSAATKTHELLRKAINYQAKKAGVSAEEWKEQNPDLLEMITDTYSKKLELLKAQEIAVIPDRKAPTSNLSYVDENNRETITGTITPLQAAKIRPIEEYGFKGKNELRTFEGTPEFETYVQECLETSQKLSDKEMNAISAYTTDAYENLNNYFLKRNMHKIFSQDEHSEVTKWHEEYDSYLAQWHDEEDLIDFATTLDGTLQKRNDEHRILYRGMSFYTKADETKDKKSELESTYIPGNEVTFDSYSSTSIMPSVAAEFGRLDNPTSTVVGVQYEIRTNAGMDVAHVSGNDEEREVILPRGIRYKVVNSYWDDKAEYKYEYVAYDGDKWNSKSKNKNVLIVQMVEVDEHGVEVNHTEDYIAPEIKSSK